MLFFSSQYCSGANTGRELDALIKCAAFYLPVYLFPKVPVNDLSLYLLSLG